MVEDTHSAAISALQQFRAARLQGNLEKIQAALSGKSADLLSYEDVRSKVNAQETNLRELKDIPLDAIAGSVGRYADFTRRFFPLQEGDENRWARVRLQAERLDGLPPIEAYQLGEAYFVIDGNHRVSVDAQPGCDPYRRLRYAGRKQRTSISRSQRRRAHYRRRDTPDF